jgi:hypothetical protein
MIRTGEPLIMPNMRPEKQSAISPPTLGPRFYDMSIENHRMVTQADWDAQDKLCHELDRECRALRERVASFEADAAGWALLIQSMAEWAAEQSARIAALEAPLASCDNSAAQPATANPAPPSNPFRDFARDRRRMGPEGI